MNDEIQSIADWDDELYQICKQELIELKHETDAQMTSTFKHESPLLEAAYEVIQSNTLTALKDQIK